MWTSLRKAGDATNKVVMPVAGAVSVTVPPGVEICAYVNGVKLPSLDGMMVAAGDTVYFELMKEMEEPSIVTVTYNGEAHSIHIEGIAYKKPKKAKREKKMDTSNLFAVPVQSGAGTMGGAIGGGLGAGLLGGVLGGALLGNNNGGLFGNRNGNSGVAIDPFQNQANMSIMSTLGDIKASVPLSQAQTAAEIMSSQASTGNIVRQTVDGIMANLNMQTQMNQRGFADTTAAVVASGTTNMLATKDLSAQTDRNAWALTQAINSDGDKTRALIQSIDKSNDSRLITNLANEISELRNEGRLTAATGNITISNNNAATANAQQQQAQQQQQAINYLSTQLAALIQQNQHIQQGVLNIGSGTVSGNSQTAANTRVS